MLYKNVSILKMDYLDICIIALGLAMDSVAISITAGLIMKNCKIKDVLPIAIYMGVFQGVMPLIGWVLGSNVAKYIQNYDHWIAFILLGIIGGKMIYETLMAKEGRCFNPKKHKVLLLLALATSIDALIIGVNFGLMNLTPIIPIIIIGVITFILSFIGVYLGNKFNKLYHFKVEAIGGVILIGIGLKILIEHII